MNTKLIDMANDLALAIARIPGSSVERDKAAAIAGDMRNEIWDAIRAGETTIRPEVMAFAVLMETKLYMNDHKGGWRNDTPEALLERLYEEVDELKEALLVKSVRIANEAADVANFAMMIADVGGFLKPRRP
jgi:hypothetical protein